MSNPVVRWQVISPNPDAAAKFYKQLFGWSFTQDNSMGQREVTAADAGVAGAIWPAPPGTQPFVQLFFAVSDVEASVRRVEELGGKTIVPRTVLPDGDVMAIVHDPFGLSIGLCTLRDG
jgi:predicted enzyme related to lactoylglutathione lyase